MIVIEKLLGVVNAEKYAWFLQVLIGRCNVEVVARELKKWDLVG